MVIFNETGPIFIPKNINEYFGDDYEMTLLSRGTQKSITFIVSDTRLVNQNYYSFNLPKDLDIDDGEYEYTLDDGEGNVVAKGLIRFGELKMEQATYNKEKEFAIYNSI